ncbi:zinc transporter family protein [Psychrobacillus soli]|uniref:Zinc transporter family protein n=1 Tax=Psychrobacillus soli TaxID=1543965 RepID=A0A544TDP4_9BACI|nr:zinc transporter family protein [Psychrobacillus soli]TQR15572.1 zinc transporter family protein [Psychrobacillus soli]
MSTLVLGGLLFLSINLGGGIAWLVARLFRRSNEGLALLCGGFLVGLLASDIIPSAFHVYESPGIVLGILIGFMFLLVVNKLLYSSSQHNSSVYLLTIALFIHTIPLSLTIGNLLGDSSFALAISTSTILHHIPEGFALTSIFLAQGQKIIGLFLSFIGLSICFSLFIWIGHHLYLSIMAQSILLGVSIGLIALTSIKEFILHNVRKVSMRTSVTFVLIGYLFSIVFHFLL